MNEEILNSTLGSLRKSGSVFGVLFSREGKELFSDLAYTPERVAELTTILDDIGFYFAQENRNPDTLAFGYDGGNLVILFREGLRLVVLHHNADEADFIASAGVAFLKDYLSGAAVLEFVEAPRSMPAGNLAPKRVVDPTQPITPVV